MIFVNLLFWSEESSDGFWNINIVIILVVKKRWEIWEIERFFLGIKSKILMV